MNVRFAVSFCGAVVALSLAATVVIMGQARNTNATTPAAKAASTAWTAPWGDPDLQGVYNILTLTPLERPAQFADKEFLTEEEAAAIERRANEGAEKEVVVEKGDTGFYNRFWRDPGPDARPRVLPTRRTSLIVDPSNGRLPPLTPRGQQIKDKVKAILDKDGPMVFNRVGPTRLARDGSNYADSYLDRDTIERCLSSALPTIAGSLVGNNGIEIVQAPGVVLMHYESGASRVIPLDGRPHLPPNIRQWMGDSRGHWEGKTLVVDVTNFNDDQGYQGGLPQGKLHLVERFTRASENMLSYEATVDDPPHFTRPWTVAYPWVKDPKYVIYEDACHEGNDSLTGILSGARAKEREAADAATKRR